MYNVVTFPNPILTAKTDPVSEYEFESGYVKNTTDVMVDVMLAYNGIGIAAPQIGVSKKMIVIDVGAIRTINEEIQEHETIVIVNPSLVFSSNEKEEGLEGCLSFPGAKAKIARYSKIEISYFNAAGEKRYLYADGLLARCIQHEMDHLDGIVMADRLTGTDKITFLSEYGKFA